MSKTVNKLLPIVIWKIEKRVSNNIEDMTNISGQNVESAIWLFLDMYNKTHLETHRERWINEKIIQLFLAEFTSRICWVSKETVSHL